MDSKIKFATLSDASQFHVAVINTVVMRDVIRWLRLGTIVITEEELKKCIVKYREKLMEYQKKCDETCKDCTFWGAIEELGGSRIAFG